ncbi:FAD-dependent oxidoreductase [Legionella oakridgensis]|uniref:FAD-dependent oxidoreductase n=1 Tax=Legionella oakridgensis TaxID=29423 RepID=UPI0003DE5C9C|nr:FAD-dependent oxidoreductase [Legionella oakridgensis]ETO93707.1 putative flavoprotein involved in K+ transport [Legionella oakridgensis RV-2-2007]
MNNETFEWAIIGAGPAGIAAVGKLLDHKINPEKILWIDPYFKVGDLGRFWKNVSSNTTVKLFIDFLTAVQSFSYQKAPEDFQLNHLPADNTCTLHHIVEPLQWITERLQSMVRTEQTFIHDLQLSQRTWILNNDAQTFKAKHVVLATGAVPDSLSYPGIDAIPFDLAIDKERLRQYVKNHETYAVFGSSHSAIIIIQQLVELGVQKVINFYRSPCRYAIPLGDWILFDNTGLKGQTAQWAREYIDGVHPHNLVRYTATEANITRFLPECQKAVYAVGFKRRKNIVINDCEQLDYNPHVGILAPGLFGVGIAFPELKLDLLGNAESQVGLWKFMTYLHKVMPIWLQYPA